MYKKFSVEELSKISTKFFDNIKNLYTARRYQFLKEFLKAEFTEWNMLYFFESSEVVCRIAKSNGDFTIYDEKEKIEVYLAPSDIDRLHNILKDDKKIQSIKKDNKTIMQSAIEWFMTLQHQELLDKPFVVYDIETIWNINNLRGMQFMIGYALISTDNHASGLKYRYIDKESLKKFVDFLLSFDGYVVWFNNIYFDNPVVCYNLGYDDEKIKMLNEKSMDIFYFIWKLTGKRIGLNKISQSLISISKTLSSWKEWEDMLREYDKTKDEALLKKVKDYCRNDVRMTLWVYLQLLKDKKLSIDDVLYQFQVKDFIALWATSKPEEDKEAVSVMSIFD